VAIGKPRGKAGLRPVYVYDPRAGKKTYVGARKNLNGPDGAKALEAQKTIEFAKAPAQASGLTLAEYAREWYELHHGPGTRRPAGSTLKVNEGNMRPFLRDFGARPVAGGINRREALRWAKAHTHNAVVVCAMFNDAIDDQVCELNPFAGRKQEGSRERKHIHPLTEGEVEVLAGIAFGIGARKGTGGSRGRGCCSRRGWGAGPVRRSASPPKDLDFARGEVRSGA
jgi:hypothetical protein